MWFKNKNRTALFHCRKVASKKKKKLCRASDEAQCEEVETNGNIHRQGQFWINDGVQTW